MKTNQPRETCFAACYFLIGFGIFCLLGTVLLAVFLKDAMLRNFREEIALERSKKELRIEAVEHEIESKEIELGFARSKLARGDIFPNAANPKVAGSVLKRKISDEIEKLEDEKARLIARKAELQAVKRRTWRDWYEDYYLEFLWTAVLPLGIFALFTMNLVFGAKLPQRNPLALTDFERRSILFVPFAILVSACGFSLFVWFLKAFG